MLLISHRGNTQGKTEFENSPNYILETLKKGYDVEIDVWNLDEEWFLGHDSPTYKIDFKFLQNSKLWIHTKNINSLEKLIDSELKYFWHQKDDFTLTSNGYIWTYPGKELTNNSICVLPEILNYFNLENCYGICSDYIEKYKQYNQNII